MDKKTMLEEQDNLVQLVNGLDYEALRTGKKKLEELSLDQLRAVHACEGWKDGMQWEDAASLWLGVDDLYPTRESILEELVNVYGY